MTPFDSSRLRLVAITDREALGMGGLVAACRAALGAGLPALMLREKDLPDEQFLPLAEALRAETARFGALLIISRRLEVARAVGADGVHLGAAGATLAEARGVLGPGALLGYSAHTESEAAGARAAGADYVTFSPVFDTPSKRDFLPPVGLPRLAELAASLPCPVVGLGGIHAGNIGEVMAAGAAGAAVIRAVFAAADPAEAVRGLVAGQQILQKPLQGA